jgi:hypothetical protein
MYRRPFRSLHPQCDDDALGLIHHDRQASRSEPYSHSTIPAIIVSDRFGARKGLQQQFLGDERMAPRDPPEPVPGVASQPHLPRLPTPRPKPCQTSKQCLIPVSSRESSCWSDDVRTLVDQRGRYSNLPMSRLAALGMLANEDFAKQINELRELTRRGRRTARSARSQPRT